MSATTGARLKPISMTTAPVTAGGSTLWITPAADEVDEHADQRASTRPATRIAPVTSAESPPWARIAATPPTNDALVPR